MTQPSSTSSGGLRSRLNSALSGLSDQLGSNLPAINSIQHTIRQAAVTHSPSQASETLKLQLAITAGAAVIRDEGALSREHLGSSKAMFLWGQSQADGPEIVDVTDRMAYLEYLTGELYAAHANSLNQSRVLLKDIRNLETDLLPRRRAHATLTTKIQALESTTKPKAADAVTLAALRAELVSSSQDLDTFEASLAAVRRTKLRESARIQYAAQKELGEKLAIVGAYGEVLAEVLEGVETGAEYSGHEKTGWVRAGVAQAVGGWSPETSHVPRPVMGAGASANLSRQDTRSFGSTHASQLSLIDQHTGPTSAQPQPPTHPEPVQAPFFTAPQLEHNQITPSQTNPATATAPVLPPRHPSPSPSLDTSALHPSGSRLGRMATTDRRRFEHAEAEIAVEGAEPRAGDELPTYTVMEEELSVEERERIEAEETEARAREAKRVAGEGASAGGER